MKIIIRQPNISSKDEIREEALRISTVFCEGCHASYDSVLPSSFTDRYYPEQQLPRFIERLENLPENNAFFIAIDEEEESNGGVVGFIEVGPKDNDSPGEEDIGEVHYIFVRTAYGGKGVGSMLMREGERYMFGGPEKPRFPKAVLKVLKENCLAVGFYEKNGWTCMPGVEMVVPQLMELGHEFKMRWFEKSC